jgi:hypothetical protein
VKNLSAESAILLLFISPTGCVMLVGNRRRTLAHPKICFSLSQTDFIQIYLLHQEDKTPLKMIMYSPPPLDVAFFAEQATILSKAVFLYFL